MHIALLGYGKMGRLVETLALRQGWEVGPMLDIDNNRGGSGITRESMAGIDAAIEFSQPEAVVANIQAAAKVGVNLVVGTTGWEQDRTRIQELVACSGIGLVYGSNFSLGMNLFFEVVAAASHAAGKIPQYDP
jgi:4-hydroxy-tetrahydrodipicolinate reductase